MTEKGEYLLTMVIVSHQSCQRRVFEIQCDGIKTFRRSSAVEQVTVNHLVTGSNPVVGANISISQATGSPSGRKLEKSPSMGKSNKNTILWSRVFVFARIPTAGP